MTTPTRKALAEYPEWRTKQCVHCKAGEPMGAMVGHHWTGDPDPPACTAQSADEYIAELERRISTAERKARAFDGMAEHGWIVREDADGDRWLCDCGPQSWPSGIGSTPLLSVENAMERKA